MHQRHFCEVNMFKLMKIRHDEIGLLFREGAFVGGLKAGHHVRFSLLRKLHLDVISMREIVYSHEHLHNASVASVVGEYAEVVDLKDHQRAIVWIDGRLQRILGPGVHAIWKLDRKISVEIIDATTTMFSHRHLGLISRTADAQKWLQVIEIARDHAGVLFVDGQFDKVLSSGRFAFWNGMSDAKIYNVDLREQTLDVSGQDLMTSDKVSLRLNTLTTYRVSDPQKAVSSSEDVQQTLYRAIQLALREAVSGQMLDDFLIDKEVIAVKALESVKSRATSLGLDVIGLGVRDIILPGDMKDLMNKVIEAKKAAEANLIFRREETAAMRSQANTAKLLESNPVLMRLRELEVLEKVASSSNLKVVLSESGLSDRLTKLI